MKVIIDADACPVWKIAYKICLELEVECVLVADWTHQFPEECTVCYVEKGSDSADYKIVELTNKFDCVITQDYGLATLVLSKGGYPISQNGMIYNNDNIMSLLENRAFNAKLRKQNIHINRPKKRTEDLNEKFIYNFKKLLLQIRGEESCKN